METVQNVDLKKYAGRWYEIASIPSRFQPRNGTNSRATYTLNEDQTIHVLNETWVNGKRSYIEGKAWKADPNSPDAKLFVKFWVPPFLPLIPVTGDYWVLDLEEENYSYALVGQPSKKYLWVLSRTPELSDEIYNKLLEKATSQGYDVSKLHKTPQPEGVATEDEGNEDKKGLWWLKAAVGK
jgi:apolipoprotein D and lipocalin family protein